MRCYKLKLKMEGLDTKKTKYIKERYLCSYSSLPTNESLISVSKLLFL